MGLKQPPAQVGLAEIARAAAPTVQLETASETANLHGPTLTKRSGSSMRMSFLGQMHLRQIHLANPRARHSLRPETPFYAMASLPRLSRRERFGQVGVVFCLRPPAFSQAAGFGPRAADHRCAPGDAPDPSSARPTASRPDGAARGHRATGPAPGSGFRATNQR